MYSPTNWYECRLIVCSTISQHNCPHTWYIKICRIFYCLRWNQRNTKIHRYITSFLWNFHEFEDNENKLVVNFIVHYIHKNPIQIQSWMLTKLLTQNCFIIFRLFRHRYSLTFHEKLFRHRYIKCWMKYLQKFTKWLEDGKNDRYVHVILSRGL